MKTTRRIGIQGYYGAFHEIAAKHFYAATPIVIQPVAQFAQLVKAIEKQDQVDEGLMAIENSIAGSLLANYQLLQKTQVHISGEVFLRISQNLMVLPPQKIEDLKEVYSHPIALAQCKAFFQQYPHIKLIAQSDTALSAKMIKDQNKKNAGAIASTLAAKLYDLEIIAPSIETYKSNYTRFLVLRPNQQQVIEPEATKVSVYFSLPHTIGSLQQVLATFTEHDANLTKIQSVPLPRSTWQYLFFVDFIIKPNTAYQVLIEALKSQTSSFKLLGKYLIGNYYES
ncbi:MAG: prephenate dehydratase [Saprospiraceae bacterium]